MFQVERLQSATSKMIKKSYHKIALKKRYTLRQFTIEAIAEYVFR